MTLWNIKKVLYFTISIIILSCSYFYNDISGKWYWKEQDEKIEIILIINQYYKDIVGTLRIFGDTICECSFIVGSMIDDTLTFTTDYRKNEICHNELKGEFKYIKEKKELIGKILDKENKDIISNISFKLISKKEEITLKEKNCE